MAILFAGTSPADFVHQGGALTATTTPTNMGPNAREGVVARINRFGRAKLAQKVSELWVAYYVNIDFGTYTSGSGPMMQFYDDAYSTVNPLWGIRLFGTGSAPTCRMAYWNGTDVVPLGELSPSPMGGSQMKRVDMHIKLHNSTGIVEAYVDGILAFTTGVTDTLHAGTGMDSLIFGKPSQVDSDDAYFSSIIVADEDTRGMVFVGCGPTADGGVSDWTGTFADVDETGINDADFITPTATGDISTFVYSAIPVGLADYDVKAVVAASRGQKGGTVPTSFDVVARIGATDFFATPTTEPPPSFGPVQAVFNANPDTLADWTNAEANAAEFGVRAVA